MIPCDRMFNGEDACVENGVTFYRWYIPDWTGNYSLTFRIVSVHSPHPQGIWITRGPGFRREMLLGNRPLPPLKSRFAHYLFRAEDCPERQFVLRVRSAGGRIMLANASLLPGTDVWDCAAGACALWVEETGRDRCRFHCNDHDEDDDFDDLVFDVAFSRE